MTNSNKIVVVPGDVRVWGNVVKELDSSDSFTKYHSTLKKTSGAVDTKDRSIFTMIGFTNTSITLNGTLADWYSSTDSFAFSITVKSVRNEPVKNSNIQFYIDNALYSTKKTNNNGVVTFTIPAGTIPKGSHAFKFQYPTSNLLNGSTNTQTVNFGVNISLSSLQDWIWAGEYETLLINTTKYGLNTAYEGIIDVVFTDTEDATNVITYKNLIIEDGEAALSQPIQLPGTYSVSVSIGADTATKNIEVIGFPNEFNNLLVWMDSCFGMHMQNQYDSTVDLRSFFNDFLEDMYAGNLGNYNLTQDENYKRLNDLLVAMHANHS